MVCETCHNLSLHQVIVVTSLRDAIDKNSSVCDTCHLLFTIIKQLKVVDENIVLATKDDACRTLQIQGIPPPVRSHLRTTAPVSAPSTLIDVFCASECKTSPHPAIKPGQIIASHSSSDQNFSRAAAWIEECEGTHGLGCSRSRNAPLPPRVIDVVGRPSDGSPFLVEAQGRYGCYATLSYCWGSVGQEKLTSTNLESFTKALPLATLSKTATDAIMICKILQIQYLWVDALCILQDDEKDWVHQSKQMRQIYSESFLTLAASSTAECSEGIFTSQSRASQRIKMKLKNQSIYAHFSPSSHLDHIGPFLTKESADLKTWHSQMELLPLCRRSWALQERVMSNRVLYYTKQEMWWECNMHIQCECGGPTKPRGKKYSPISSYSWLRNPLLGEITEDEAYGEWKEIVTLFSMGALTRPGDKLPALSGLAKQFEVMLWHRFKEKDVYYAGLWKSQMSKTLTWHRIPVSDTVISQSPVRPHEWRAPSWSWASLDGAVQFPREEYGTVLCLKNIDVSVELATTNQHGALVGGQLILDGVLHPGRLIKRYVNKPDYTIKLNYDVSLLDTFLGCTFFPDDEGELSDGMECYCVLATGTPESRSLKDDHLSAVQIDDSSLARFLVFKKEDCVEEKYKRIGLAACRVALACIKYEKAEVGVKRKIMVV
jgi:hypothetical protein